MTAAAHVQRSSPRQPASRTGFATVPRGWTDVLASAPAPARARGHDLSRIHVSAPAADAPIQRLKWTWDGKTRTWSSASGPTTTTPPSHVGAADGEEYDDTYSQATDPTATPHLRPGASYFGESGARQQVSGRAPAAAQIREPAVGGPGRSGGAGLHEIVPTNLRGWVARTGNQALIGAQSGFRTATDYQLFSPTATSTGEVGGHTGFFRNPSGSGSTHTRGQAPAHDTLRQAAETVEDEADPDVVVNTLALAHLSSTPHGQEVLQSDYITGARPNRTASSTVGPVATGGAPPDPTRLALAREVHQRREVVKARERGRARERDPGRTRLPSPSPERTPIDGSGGGGGHVTGDRTTWATAPVPSFPGKRWKKVANETAWLSQPQRHPFDVSRAPLVRPAPSTGGPPSTTPVTLSPPVSASTALLAPLATPAPPTTTSTPVLPPTPLATATPPAPPLAPLPALPTTTATAPRRRRRGRGRKRKQPTPSPAPATITPTPATAPTSRYPARKRQKTSTYRPGTG